MQDSNLEPSSSDCWEARRKPYNQALLISGALAFFVYAIIGNFFLSKSEDFEITLFTLILQGIGFGIAMGIANGCYSIGSHVESFLSRSSVASYRIVAYRSG